MTDRRSLLVVAALAVVGVVGLVLVVTGGEDEPEGSLPLGTTSKAQLAALTGIEFPSSVTSYRTVRLDPDQLDVTFELPAADVGSLVSSSQLPPLSPTRVISHASPLWDLNTTSQILGTTTTRNGLTLALETVSGDPTVVRLHVVAQPTD